MRDYKKIYQKLVKVIKNELESHKCDNFEEIDERINFLDNIENKYGISLLEWILSMLPEIEGKKCQGITMNKKEFKKWKKQIKGK